MAERDIAKAGYQLKIDGFYENTLEIEGLSR